MKRHSKTVLAITVVLAALTGGWLVLAPAAMWVHAAKVEPAGTEASAILDGMSFVSELGPLGKPGDITDFLIFENGMFVSKECERRCAYPPAPYFIRHVGGKTEFVAETHCSDKDSTIVWRGTVDVANGTIEGTFTWTADRWYWTVEKDFWFEGTLADRDIPLASER